MTVSYRLGVSAFVAESATGHDWAALARLPVRHFEIGALQDREALDAAAAVLHPASMGIHWPLYRADGGAYHLLAAEPSEFAELMGRIRQRLAGSGAAYLLMHLGQRGEPWPDADRVHERLAGLAALGRDLGLELVLEPKESVAQGDGLSGFVGRVSALPPGTALCVDTNDWASARRHLGRGVDCLAGRAQYFHLHAMHVRPDSGGLYLHAPPWVPPGADPAWPEVAQPSPEELDRMADRARAVAVQVEVHPRYLARMPEALAAVRATLAGMGWREADPEPVSAAPAHSAGR